MTRAEIALNYFNEGYACSQAVVLAFKDLVNISEEELSKISIPFGGGLGRLRLTCGALSGMAMIIGLLFSKDENTNDNKMNVYAIIQKLSEKFIEVNWSLNCEELLKLAQVEVEKKGKPEERTFQYYNKRPCGKIVYKAANILEEYLIEENVIKEWWVIEF